MVQCSVLVAGTSEDVEKQLKGTLCGAVGQVLSKDVSVTSYYGETLRLSVGMSDTLLDVRNTVDRGEEACNHGAWLEVKRGPIVEEGYRMVQ
eukprot:15326941-Ditylum_brightwellii.AAC.1